MSYFDGMSSTYTFQLRIRRSDRTILDTSITAEACADEVAKAKKNIQQLLNEYVPTLKPLDKAPTQVQETAPPSPTEPDAQTDETPVDQQEQQTEPSAPQSAAPIPDKKPDRVKGLVRLRCSECGSTFGTFLREYQSEIVCKCGHSIDLTAPLAKYRFTCPYCEKKTWGHTNLEDPDITIKCKCGGDVNLWWNPKTKEYQN